MEATALDVRAECKSLRSEAKTIAAKVLAFKGRIAAHGPFPGSPLPDLGEMLANVTLAYRHLEDAAMRLGKVIQAYDGGVSVYDK